MTRTAVTRTVVPRTAVTRTAVTRTVVPRTAVTRVAIVSVPGAPAAGDCPGVQNAILGSHNATSGNAIMIANIANIASTNGVAPIMMSFSEPRASALPARRTGSPPPAA